VEAYPNGWYRIIITFTTAATPITLFGGVYISASNGALQGVNPAGNDCYIWGIQSELGSFATSYIPTTTGTLARSADACSITGSAFSGFYNQSEGTFASEAMITNLVGGNRGVITIDNGTTLHHIRHNYVAAVGGFITTIKANDADTLLGVIAGSASTTQKRATAYSGTSFANVVNGGVPATATRTMPTGLNVMRIGSVLSGSLYLSGHISSIRYYRKRLSNAKLQALTV
jgi:hypothetical protein